MNTSTASGRLVKDILYSLVVKTGQNNCFVCGFPMSRDTFSIEHKTPWLGSENPVKLFFDLENIAFSHHKCNIRAARKTRASCGSPAKYAGGCRCDICKSGNAARARARYKPELRAAKYARIGK